VLAFDDDTSDLFLLDELVDFVSTAAASTLRFPDRGNFFRKIPLPSFGGGGAHDLMTSGVRFAKPFFMLASSVDFVSTAAASTLRFPDRGNFFRKIPLPS